MMSVPCDGQVDVVVIHMPYDPVQQLTEDEQMWLMSVCFSRHTLILRQANLTSFLWCPLMCRLLNSEQCNQPTVRREFWRCLFSCVEILPEESGIWFFGYFVTKFFQIQYFSWEVTLDVLSWLHLLFPNLSCLLFFSEKSVIDQA